MTIAPNETPENYARKNELWRLEKERSLTNAEWQELRQLTGISISHLVFSTTKKGT